MYKTTLPIYLIISILYGCLEDEQWPPCDEIVTRHPVIPLYVDSQCSETDLRLHVRAVEKLNELTRHTYCQNTVKLIGTKTIDDHNDARVTEGNVSVCYYDKPDYLEGWVKGETTYFKAMRLYLFRTGHEDITLSLIMHELLHYIGGKGHETIDDPYAVILGSAHYKTEYSDGDKYYLCNSNEYFDCIE